MANQPPVSQHEVSTNPPQLVTATTLSNSLPQVSTSSLQLDGTITTLQPSAPIPFVSTPEIITENLEPPPLIPAASYTAVSSLTTQQRPVTLSVPDVRSLHNTSSVNHFAIQEPLPGTLASAGSYHGTQQFATSRLPKLTLPTFSGDPLTWQTFRDSFHAAIHANTSLSGIQKFNYLNAPSYP